jgi:hypothetical protein
MIVAAYGISQPQSCGHAKDTPLDPHLKDKVTTTSIAAPEAEEGKIAIVQVARNPTAQLLACVWGVPAILQKGCFLPCAYQQAIDDTEANIRMIIAG